MSIKITIREQPATFGMLPVGSTFTQRPDDAARLFKTHAPMAYNATREDGSAYGFLDDEVVYNVVLPPGASLATKPKMVRAMDTKVGDVVRLNDRVLCIGGGTPSATMQYVWDAATKVRDSISNAQMVQPCHVEIIVTPEVES